MSNSKLDAANARVAEMLGTPKPQDIGETVPHKPYTTIDGIYVRGSETEAQARAEREEHHKWKSVYGAPEYGGWRTSLVDGRHKPIQVCENEEAAAMRGEREMIEAR